MAMKRGKANGPAARVLRGIVENQRSRTKAALKALREEVFALAPPDDGRSIREVGRHMLSLRGMQWKALHADGAAKLPSFDPVTSVQDLARKLDDAAARVRDAITDAACGDLLNAYPRDRTSRPGETRLDRLIVRLNDFTNHNGDIRTLRRILAGWRG